jgi:hypothetical protein
MEESPVTRACLEKLTTGELLVLADSQGIDIPFGLERNFIMEEILDGGDEGRFAEEEEPGSLEEADILEPAPLPKQYNITYIDIIVRDPLWVYAFWEIKAADKDVFEKDRDFGGYFLKVVPKEEHSGDSFTVSVGTGDTGWYLGFSMEPGRGRRCFQVELCVDRGDETPVLAVSRPFSLPPLLAASGGGGAAEPSGLCLLSGLDDLPVLRSVDRRSSNIRGCCPGRAQ